MSPKVKMPYKMNKYHGLGLPPVVGGGLFLGIVLFSSNVALGADPYPITYDGSSSYSLDNPSTFFPMPNGAPNAANSLFPHDHPSGNWVILDGVSITGNAYGGIAGNTSSFAASGNFLDIVNGASVQDVVGGLSASPNKDTNGASAGYNCVTIEDSTVRGSVYGGRAVSGADGNVSDNLVEISGNSKIGGKIYGAYSNASGLVQDNEVLIDDNVQVTASDGAIAGGYGVAASTVSGNVVKISGGTIRDSKIYGGRIQGVIVGGIVKNNTVIITDGTISSTTGTNPGIYGGYKDVNSGSVNNNTVRISGGNITADIYGGRVHNASGSSGGSVTDNKIFLSGGKINGTIYGGRAINGQVKDNTLTIEGASPLNLAAATLVGSVSTGTVSGNTFDLKRAGVTAAGLSNWQNLNFYLPTTVGNGDVMLTVTGTANIGGSTVNVGVNGASSPLAVGDIVRLIDAGTLAGTPANNNGIVSGTGMQGVTLLYDFRVYTDGNKLLAEIEKAPPEGKKSAPPKSNPNEQQLNELQPGFPATPLLVPETPGTSGTGAARVNPRAKALSEGFLAGSALTAEAGDFLAAKGVALARQEGLLPGYNIFGTIGGDWLRYDTGSRIDIDAYTILTGVAKGGDLAKHHLTVGAFGEFGHGGYDTYNSFTNAAAVHSNGDIDYVGGGLLGRVDFHGLIKGAPYVEGTARIGQVKSNFESWDLVDFFGRRAALDSSSLYYGMHVGIGYLFDITEKIGGDLYVRHIWTHQEGDDVRISTGESLTFDNVDLQRTRLGARLNRKIKEWLVPYIGAAWEHEFDGQTRGSVYGYKIDAPDLKGDTGVGEIGLTAMNGEKLSFEFGVEGYAGTREGISGSARLSYRF